MPSKPEAYTFRYRPERNRHVDSSTRENALAGSRRRRRRRRRLQINSVELWKSSRCTAKLTGMLRSVSYGTLRQTVRRFRGNFLRRCSSAPESKPGRPSEPTHTTTGSSWRQGPVTWRSLAITTGVGAGIGFLYWQQKERKAKELERSVTAQVSSGKPAIGGPFQLVDARTRQTVTDADFRGRLPLFYFGFTHCPDVCPDELTKISKALALLDQRLGHDRVSATIAPVFISVDPERDTPDVVNEFLRNEEFDERFVGLTGSVEQCAAAARAFHVYYMKTDESEDDYLVDHSIITYLMGPDGDLLDYFGKNISAEEMAQRIEGHWKRMRLSLA